MVNNGNDCFINRFGFSYTIDVLLSKLLFHSELNIGRLVYENPGQKYRLLQNKYGANSNPNELF